MKCSARKSLSLKAPTMRMSPASGILRWTLGLVTTTTSGVPASALIALSFLDRRGRLVHTACLAHDFKKLLCQAGDNSRVIGVQCRAGHQLAADSQRLCTGMNKARGSLKVDSAGGYER